jgi:hypothetical protein
MMVRTEIILRDQREGEKKGSTGSVVEFVQGKGRCLEKQTGNLTARFYRRWN